MTRFYVQWDICDETSAYGASKCMIMAELLPVSVLEDKAQNLGLQLVC